MEFQPHHPSSSRYIGTGNACYNTNYSAPPRQHEQHRQQFSNQHMDSARDAVDRREDFTGAPENQWDDLVQNLGDFFFCQGPCFVDTSNSSENPRTSAPESPSRNHAGTPMNQPPTRDAPIRFPSIHLDMDEDWSDTDNAINSSAYFFEARASAANRASTANLVTPPSSSKQVLRQKESIYRAPSSTLHNQAKSSTSGVSLYPPIPSAAGLYRSPVIQSSSDEEEDCYDDENISMDGSYEEGWDEKRASPLESSETEKQHQMNLAHVQELFNGVGLSL